MGYDRNAHSWVKGSQVLLSNGKTKAIEKLVPATQKDPKGGDVLTTLNGNKAYVVGTMVGPEKPEVIRVTVEVTSTVRTGEVFSTTINHSHGLMSDTNSMVPANSLKVNDNIQTIYGRAVVRSLEHLDYDKDMYQFFLASKKFVDNVISELNEEELFRHLSNSMLGLTPHDHLAFVDGILSSDWIIQHELENKISKGISLTEIR